MLATLPRAAPRAARRALTTGSATRAPLAPPYEHSIRSPLAPPYAQHMPAAAAGRLQPTYAYQLLTPAGTPAPTPQQWVASVLETEQGRQWAQTAWDEVLVELAKPTSTPEIPFQALTAVLADASMRELLASAGGVVVRDVVRDALAEAWAAELLADASRWPVFHHEAQVAARADCSVLSATGQVLRALVPAAAKDESAFIRVDAVASAPAPSDWTGKSLWDVPTSAPATPLHAHLALARTDFAVPTSSAAATYALLRPHFAPKASRISFYASADYLAPSNWVLRGRVADAEPDADHVHVRPARVSLAPGDVLLTHAGLRLAAADGAGLVLPVHPLPATPVNKAFVARQRAAFEAGLPPPHVQAQARAPVKLETAGDASWIETHAGRRAMGYDA